MFNKVLTISNSSNDNNWRVFGDFNLPTGKARVSSTGLLALYEVKNKDCVSSKYSRVRHSAGCIVAFRGHLVTITT